MHTSAVRSGEIDFERCADYCLVMTATTEKLMDEVLDLPADERLSLVDRLIASLNLPTQTAIDRLWAEEAERRLAQIDRGEVELIPGEQVFAEIRAKYRR